MICPAANRLEAYNALLKAAAVRDISVHIEPDQTFARAEPFGTCGMYMQPIPSQPFLVQHIIVYLYDSKTPVIEQIFASPKILLSLAHELGHAIADLFSRKRRLSLFGIPILTYYSEYVVDSELAAWTWAQRFLEAYNVWDDECEQIAIRCLNTYRSDPYKLKEDT